MFQRRGRSRQARSQRGASLFLIAASLVVLLAMAGLAIDLASLYVARSEAQRAADAAALGGAQVFVTSGFTSGGVSQATVQTLAMNQAIAVGDKDVVGGQNPNIGTKFSSTCPPPAGGDGCFDFSIPGDPRITVVVQRTAERGDPLPTFFMKIFGILSKDVAAQATAEAYNPSGTSGPVVGTACVKPWIVPNCDPAGRVTKGLSQNPFCGVDYLIDPATGAIVHPGLAPNGVIGELMILKPGNPSQAAAPSKYYEAYIPPGPTQAPCPSCGKGGGGGGPNSGALYRQNIECCNTNTIFCGTTTIQPVNGNKVGPTKQGVDCLIHQPGQDTLNTSVNPFEMIAGSANPYVPPLTPVKTSDSLVTVAIWDGTPLCPGNSCGSSVTVVGFLQLFIKEETNPQGTVEAYIMNVSGCGSTAGNGNPPPVNGGGGNPIPVRLIHN